MELRRWEVGFKYGLLSLISNYNGTASSIVTTYTLDIQCVYLSDLWRHSLLGYSVKIYVSGLIILADNKTGNQKTKWLFGLDNFTNRQSRELIISFIQDRTAFSVFSNFWVLAKLAIFRNLRCWLFNYSKILKQFWVC